MEKSVFCIYDLRMIKAALQGQLDKDSFTRAVTTLSQKGLYNPKCLFLKRQKL